MTKQTVTMKDIEKKSRLNQIGRHLSHIEEDYGDTGQAWLRAYHYLESKGIDTYFLAAVGIGVGHDVREWMYDYYVADQNDGAKMADRIAHELNNIDDEGVYLDNQGLDAYNHGTFTPTDVTVAGSGTIQEAFHQMIKSLHDFPEKY